MSTSKPHGGLALPGQTWFRSVKYLGSVFGFGMLSKLMPKPALEFQQNLSTFAHKIFAKNCVHAEVYVYRKLFLLATKAHLLFRQKPYRSIEMPCKHIKKCICKTLVKKLQKLITS